MADQGNPLVRSKAALPGYVFRTLQVLRTETLTPSMRRITLGGPEIAGFGQDRTGPNVKIYLPLPGQDRPVMPVVGQDGVARWPPDDQRPTMRTYTVRHFDEEAQELQLDFVLHEPGGVASDWARNAVPGDHLGITGPGGRTVKDADWYLIVGDEAALPAITIIAEKLPADAHGIILIEVADTTERLPITAPPGVAVHWLYRKGTPAGRTTLLTDAVHTTTIPDDREVFAWVSAESATVRTLRGYLRDEIGLSRTAMLTIGYWKVGMPETTYSAMYDNDRESDHHSHN